MCLTDMGEGEHSLEVLDKSSRVRGKGLPFSGEITVSVRSWTVCNSALCRIELELLSKALCCGESGLKSEDLGPSPRHPTS